MKFQHLLTVMMAGMVLNVSLSFVYAPREVQELERYKLSLEENVQKLLLRNQELEFLYYQLQDDSAAIIKEANRIGMVFPGDEMIQVHHRERRIESLSPGETLLLVKAKVQASALIRNISLSFSLLAAFVMLAVYKKNDGWKAGSEIVDGYRILRASK